MNENLIAGIVCAGCGLVLKMNDSESASVPFGLAVINFMLWMI